MGSSLLVGVTENLAEAVLALHGVEPADGYWLRVGALADVHAGVTLSSVVLVGENAVSH
jgi:hypothetical protein